MPSVIRAYFRPGIAAARLQHRPDHIRHILAHLPQIVCAGALCSEAQAPLGVFLAVQGDSAHAQALLESDPYHRAGLFERVEIEPFLQFVPHANPRLLDEELERALRSAAAAAT